MSALALAAMDPAGPADAQKPSVPDIRSFDAYAGYGVRKVGDPAPVDPRAVFAIGSSTKAFTSAAVAALVDDDNQDMMYLHFRRPAEASADGLQREMRVG